MHAAERLALLVVPHAVQIEARRPAEQQPATFERFELEPGGTVTYFMTGAEGERFPGSSLIELPFVSPSA